MWGVATVIACKKVDKITKILIACKKVDKITKILTL